MLGKALELGLIPIVVINKVDKENYTPDLVQEQVFDLMFNLGATEEQLDFTTVYGSAKMGWMGGDWQAPTEDMTFLMDTILESVPEAPYVVGTPSRSPPSITADSPDGSPSVACSRGICTPIRTTCSARRKASEGPRQGALRLQRPGQGKGGSRAVRRPLRHHRHRELRDWRHPVGSRAARGHGTHRRGRHRSLLFTINTSPFLGKDGEYLTSRHIRERLDKELQKNLALRVNPPTARTRTVHGRGILHLSVLIETGAARATSSSRQAEVIYKEVEGPVTNRSNTS